MTDPLLDADEIIARAREIEGPDGRLQVHDLSSWDIFPFDGTVVMQHLQDAQLPEPARHGVAPGACGLCNDPDNAYLWTNANWRLKSHCATASLPEFILESRHHYDLHELPDNLVADLGPITLRIERAIASIDGVARVHIHRWGDGAEHFHLWFQARPEGMPQLRGMFMPTWMEALPPLTDDVRVAIEGHVASQLG